MASIFDSDPKGTKPTTESKNAYVKHARDGKDLVLTLDTDKIRESESGKVYTMFVSFNQGGRRIWGNLNITK